MSSSPGNFDQREEVHRSGRPPSGGGSLTVQTCQSEVIHSPEGCASTVLQQALKSAGIEFIDENGDGPGLRKQ